MKFIEDTKKRFEEFVYEEGCELDNYDNVKITSFITSELKRLIELADKELENSKLKGKNSYRGKSMGRGIFNDGLSKAQSILKEIL